MELQDPPLGLDEMHGHLKRRGDVHRRPVHLMAHYTIPVPSLSERKE